MDWAPETRDRIGTLRLHGRDEAAVLRLRLGRLLERADPRPPGVPPAAVLIVRRLADPRPARLRAAPGAVVLDPDWEQAWRAELGRLYARAAQPAAGAVAADVEAVRFADAAEMLACLLADRCTNRVVEHWWWRLLAPGHGLGRSGADSSGALVYTLLAEQPARIPAIFHHLERMGRAASVVEALSSSQAARLIGALERAYDLPDPAAEQTPPARSRPQTGVEATAASGQRMQAAPGGVAQHPEKRTEITPPPPADSPGELLQSLALVLFRHPSAARDPALRQRLPRSPGPAPKLPQEPPHPAAVSVHGHTGEADVPTSPAQPSRPVPLVPAAHDLRPGSPTVATPASSTPGALPGTPRRLATTKGAETVPSPDPISRISRPRLAVDPPRSTASPEVPLEPPSTETDQAPRRTNNLLTDRTEADPVPVPAPSPVPGTEEPPDRETADPGSTPHDSASPSSAAGRRTLGEAAADGVESPSPAAEPAAGDDFDFADGVDTELGGILYLLNLALHLDLPDCFEASRALASRLGAWGTLEALARGLLDGEPDAEDDPFWPALTALSGRGPETLLGEDLPWVDDFRLPPDWPLLLGDPLIDRYAWCSAGDRLRVWSERGYLLCDRPGGGDAAAAGRALGSTLCGADLASGENSAAVPEVQVQALSAPALHPGDPSEAPVAKLFGLATTEISPSLRSWLAAVLPYVVLYLRQVFDDGGMNEGSRPGPALLHHPGRLYLSSTHVDLVLPLDRVSLPVRMAGMDRNPGWVPQLGRVVSLHFD
jgi:hypothetical protein